MTTKAFYLILLAALQAAALLLLSHYGYQWVAVILVVAPQVVTWLRGGRTAQGAAEAIATSLAGVSIAIIIGLSRQSEGSQVFPPVSQVLLSVMYAAILVWRSRPGGPHRQLAFAAINQLLATSAVFLISTFWHWPAVLIVALMWGVSFVIAWTFLHERGDSSAAILAATWGLVTAEVTWVLQTWLVNYILGGGYIIVPQAAVVILGIAYCFMHIYLAHTTKLLSRRRLLEYVTIAAILLAIVMAGTRWNGSS